MLVVGLGVWGGVEVFMGYFGRTKGNCEDDVVGVRVDGRVGEAGRYEGL